jgi:hypothetical protein
MIGGGAVSDNASAPGTARPKVQFDSSGNQKPNDKENNAPKLSGSKMFGRSEKSKEDIYAEKTVAEMQALLAAQFKLLAEVENEYRIWRNRYGNRPS